MIIVGCPPSAEKVGVDTGSTISAGDEGADEGDWWEDGNEDDGDGSGSWEQVEGFSFILTDEESGEDVWFFVEALEEEVRLHLQ